MISAAPGRNGSMPARDVDRKHELAAELLRETGCEHLLLVDPANVAWFCGTGAVRSGDPNDQPAVFLNDKLRWLVASNLDAPRWFAGPLDDQGFQLKEWPWHLGRDSWLADLCIGRKTACDRPARDTEFVGDRMKRLRRRLSAHEHQKLEELGIVVAHAVEATGRNLTPGQSEAEVAGQLGHRLLHHGAEPVTLTVTADGRFRHDRRPGFGTTPVQKDCVIAALATRHGLHAFAARTVSLGRPEARLKADAETAGRLFAAWCGSALPGASGGEVVRTGLAVAGETAHEWYTCPPGFVTGYAAVESWLAPTLTDPLVAGSAIAWMAGVGAAAVGNTLVVGTEARLITPGDNWPARRIKIGSQWIFTPDLLVR